MQASNRIKLVKIHQSKNYLITLRGLHNMSITYFCQTVPQSKNLQEQISIAMRKHSSPLNASMF